ncbi:LOW QUALITY PROTEIN: galactinol synthase 2-like [Asparagus officinalis]|uniref:LOW QUALITY PROTEIN: galactinol synthase 2-like n=1 Tax=Asparagus officinalis TaxID=4686 RepID=UPI00098E552F|nr:LOW QUALITY PROTEIN: galactinol synthase 2-like [Asparagus officinalis]
MAPTIINKALTTTPAGFKKPASMGPRRAYVTFLAGDGDYVKGVVGLAKGLRKTGTPYPLVVAVLPDVPVSHRQGCIVREIEPVHPPENQTQFAMAYYVINYSKLRIWGEFVDYSKMIYLDADIQVCGNIDELFDLPGGYFYAVMDCFCEKTWMPSHTKSRYCQQMPRLRSSATRSEQDGPTAADYYFHAGMFVFEPSVSTCEALLSTLKVTPPTAFAEQDFLNMFFRDIYKPIPLVYNLVLAMLWRHPENVQLDKVKVVHYCAAGSKPWRYTGKEENMDREDIKALVEKWWDIYNDATLDYKVRLVAFEEQVANQTLLVTLPPVISPLVISAKPIAEESVEGIPGVTPPPAIDRTTEQETWLHLVERYQKMRAPKFRGSSDSLVAHKWKKELELSKLEQGDMSVADYESRFMSLLRFTGMWQTRERYAQMFLLGLRPRLRCYLISRGFHSVREKTKEGSSKAGQHSDKGKGNRPFAGPKGPQHRGNDFHYQQQGQYKKGSQ